MASLRVQLRDMKETLGQKETLDQQLKVHISRLAENVHSFAESMNKYVMMLGRGQMHEEDGDGGDERSCSTDVVLNHVQGSLAKLDDLQDSMMSLVQSMDVRGALNLTNPQQRSRRLIV